MRNILKMKSSLFLPRNTIKSKSGLGKKQLVKPTWDELSHEFRCKVGFVMESISPAWHRLSKSVPAVFPPSCLAMSRAAWPSLL